MVNVLNQGKLVLLTFITSIAISIYSIYLLDQYSYQQKRISIQKVASSYVSHIRNDLNQALSATYPLAALIRTQNGDVSGFTELATEMLPLYSGISALQLQPGGILKHVVPLEGNEGAIGHNLLLNPDRTKEAFLARDSGKLTLAGPFNLTQGGVGAAARLPIYLDTDEGKQFWGFATALIRFPDILHATDLPSLVDLRIDYQLSRIHPDTGEIQVISKSNKPLIENPVIFNILVPNGSWTFQAFPSDGWRDYLSLSIASLLAFLFVILATTSAFLLARLRHHHQRLEQTVIEKTKSLYESNQNYLITLNSIGDAVIVTDANGAITFLNPVAEELTGWTHEEAQQKPLAEVFNIVHAHTLNPAENPVEKVIETGKVVGLANHTMLISKNGTEYQIADSGAPVRSPNGETSGVVLVFRDVTEEYALNEKLESSQSFMSTLLRALPDMVWVKNIDGVYLSCNEKFERMFGAEVKQIIGRTDYDFVDKSLADFFRGNDKVALNAGGPTVNEETVTFANDGHTELLETIKTPILDSSGKLIGILGIARDITHHKVAESKLIASESRLQEVQDYAQIAHWSLLPDIKTAVWSEQIYTIFGLSPNVKPGPEILREIIHKSDFPSLDESIKKSFSTGSEHHVEYRIVRPSDGEERWIECRGRPVFDSKGVVEKVSGFIQDITERKQAEQVALQNEERYAKIFESSLTEIFIFDAETYQFIQVNHGARENIGYTDEELKNLTAIDIKPEVSLEQFNALVEPLLTGKKEVIQFETVQQRKNGTLYNVEIHLQLTNFLARPAFVAIILDITARKKAEEKHKLSSRVFSDTHEGIIITDANEKIIDVNPAFCEITGYGYNEIMGETPRVLSSGKHAPEFYKEMWQDIDKQGHWQGEVWNRAKSGEMYAELLTISMLKDEAGNIVNYIGVFTDITSSKRQQEQLHLMAHYDVLTGLPNRALFVDRFHQAIAHSKRTEFQLAVCFLDLDNFKPVNDNYGHEIGDELLIEVAKRIKSCLREEDTVSRQGGDEFALLLNDIVSFAQVEQTLERIHNTLGQPYLINKGIHNITASSGVTLYPSDDSDIDTLLRHADNAMYQAKQTGRNRYHLFNTEHDLQVVLKHHRLDEIKQALSNNEFELYYQPKVNMLTGKVFGAEALIRWVHPEKGIIPPLEFLPIVEGTDLEIKIGNWVIEQGLMQLKAWQQLGIKIEVSVNIASYHLLSEHFLSTLAAILAKYSTIDSQDLQLEILESSALGDLSTINHVLIACQMTQGVTVALDDFGTSYSSLTHLRSLPANSIKIDQSFVRDMLDDPSDFAIIDGVIGLTNAFNRDVIAEGVETTEHGLMLITMGCYEAQGDGIAKPMSAPDFPEWLKSYKPNKKWLDCAGHNLTDKEAKIKLFRLTETRWRQRFISNIQASPGEIKAWPIMVRNNCHCGVWINRAKQEQLFSKAGLVKLEQAHEKIHLIGNTIRNKYQDGDVTNARDELTELQAAFDLMNNVLEEM